VGDQYYLVNSTFAYFPGVPVYRSTDLVHWEQLGHVLDRPSQLPLDGAGVSRGIFAPTISHHDGLFYMVTTNVSGPGNFYVTARDPVGPWSEPVALEGVDGIDPSFFFDEVTGRAWLVNNGPPPDNKPLYDGHRAIWIQEFDAASGRLVGPRSIIVNGGVDLAAKPVWVEGPHIFRRGEWLYLSCAEGGTSENHSQVIFRAKEATGPWEAWSGNPILTQRDLPADRPLPVTCTGHADYVDAGEAGWWAVFLGCRPYEGNNYITGRETFLLPVTWTEDGWPVILPRGEVVPYVAQAPALPKTDGECLPTGNFTWVDDFSDPWLRSDWQMLRTPRDCWWSLGERAGDDALLLRPKYVWLCSRAEQPAFLGYRVQHARCEINLDVAVPTDKVTDAGLGVFQGEGWFYFLGVRICPEKGVVAFLETMTGGTTRDFVWRECDAAPGSIVHLKALIDGATCRFSFSTDGVQWTQFAECDASILTTAKAGGFVGTMAGPHARLRWQ
jgi:alpha-N-arabinofuranosidase